MGLNPHRGAQLKLLSVWLIVFLGVTGARAQGQFQAKPQPTSATSSTLGRSSDRTVEISPEDILEINVFDVPQLSGRYHVSPAGTIDLPLVPAPIRAEGLTPEGLSGAIRVALQTRGLVSDPRVTVQIEESRYHSIAILGAVAKPQLYTVLGHTTLLDALAQAQGLSDDAGNVVVITRGGSAASQSGFSPGLRGAYHEPLRYAHSSTSLAVPEGSRGESDSRSESVQNNGRPEALGPQTISVDLRRLMETGDARLNVTLYPGDRVLVTRATVVYVAGAVNHPAGFAMNDEHSSLTALKAIALAEGLTSTAKLNKAVIIREQAQKPGATIELPVKLKAVLAGRAPDPRLQPNDILFIPDSNSQKALRHAAEAAVQTASGVLVWRVPF
jgi:polysaccharide biosynthesis/export protein